MADGLAGTFCFLVGGGPGVDARVEGADADAAASDFAAASNSEPASDGAFDGFSDQQQPSACLSKIDFAAASNSEPASDGAFDGAF